MDQGRSANGISIGNRYIGRILSILQAHRTRAARPSHVRILARLARERRVALGGRFAFQVKTLPDNRPVELRVRDSSTLVDSGLLWSLDIPAGR